MAKCPLKYFFLILCVGILNFSISEEISESSLIVHETNIEPIEYDLSKELNKGPVIIDFSWSRPGINMIFDIDLNYYPGQDSFALSPEATLRPTFGRVLSLDLNFDYLFDLYKFDEGKQSLLLGPSILFQSFSSRDESINSISRAIYCGFQFLYQSEYETPFQIANTFLIGYSRQEGEGIESLLPNTDADFELDHQTNLVFRWELNIDIYQRKYRDWFNVHRFEFIAEIDLYSDRESSFQGVSLGNLDPPIEKDRVFLEYTTHIYDHNFVIIPTGSIFSEWQNDEDQSWLGYRFGAIFGDFMSLKFFMAFPLGGEESSSAYGFNFTIDIGTLFTKTLYKVKKYIRPVDYSEYLN